MTDITMCTVNCPVKEKCYRYMATPNIYGQTYSFLEEICIPSGYSEMIPYEPKKDDYTLNDFIADQIRIKKH